MTFTQHIAEEIANQRENELLEIYRDSLIQCPCGARVEPSEITAVDDIVAGKFQRVGLCPDCLAIYKIQNT